MKGLGPFASGLVVIRGANFLDLLPGNEAQLGVEMTELYGSDRSVEQITAARHPYRTWASVHLRALCERRTQGTERPREG